MSKKDPIGVKPIVKLIDETNKTRHNINNNRSSLGAVSSFVSKAKDKEKKLSEKEDEKTAQVSVLEFLNSSQIKPRSWQVFEQKGTTILSTFPNGADLFTGKVPKGQVLLIDFISCTVGWRDTTTPTNVALSNFLDNDGLGLANFGFNLITNKNLVETDNLNNFFLFVKRPDGFSKLNENVLSYNGTSRTLALTENFDYRLQYTFDQDPATEMPQPSASGAWFVVGRIQGYFITNQEYEKILKLTS